ncbi:MAG: hypothetical protein K6G64_10420 [Eubacterium sp.]|nr:hypothetical protein [Eubacterium sp.]
MKKIRKNKSVKTIPKGIWEGTPPQKKKTTSSPTTDLQGNGYPKDHVEK